MTSPQELPARRERKRKIPHSPTPMQMRDVKEEEVWEEDTDIVKKEDHSVNRRKSRHSFSDDDDEDFDSLFPFEPVLAIFLPSQHRNGHKFAFYQLPDTDNPKLYYKFSFRRKLLNGAETYVCSQCRSMKELDKKLIGKVPLVHIKDGYFVTDPCRPSLHHFCEPKELLPYTMTESEKTPVCIGRKSRADNSHRATQLAKDLAKIEHDMRDDDMGVDNAVDMLLPPAPEPKRANLPPPPVIFQEERVSYTPQRTPTFTPAKSEAHISNLEYRRQESRLFNKSISPRKPPAEIFRPVHALFKPSQQRGPDIAVYVLPGNEELCYEFSYKRSNKAGNVKTYICCGCRSLKDTNRHFYGLVPGVRISGDGRFLNDPAFPNMAHYCQPKNATRALMRREVIKVCNDLRLLPERPTGETEREMIEVINRVESAYLDQHEKDMLLDEIASGKGITSLKRTLQRNKLYRRTIKVEERYDEDDEVDVEELSQDGYVLSDEDLLEEMV